VPAGIGRVDYEGELAIVIGGLPVRRLRAEDASSAILGYTIANDVTAREQQKSDGQWTRGKGHDTFCPLGPWIETNLDPSGLDLRTELDGELKQDGNTSDLLHGVGEILEWITAGMTLLPGDVVLTGTPAGVGPMTAGQTVSVSVEGIGTLTNKVAAV
jgi:2-keto-4-pentenoate hydratase/2-oxohepta-3-ene-1,7-dioic acid hydratase in catechol pathway